MFSWCSFVFTLSLTFLHLLSRNLLNWEQLSDDDHDELTISRNWDRCAQPATPLSMLPRREFRVAGEKDSVIVYFLVESDTCRCCCTERYFFVTSWEFPTFIHHRRLWFSLKHVSVERGEESEEKKAKATTKKLLLLLFISLSFISIPFHELLWKKREEMKWNWK